MSLFFQWWGKVYVSGRAAGGRCAGAARAGAAGGGGAGEHLLRRVSEVQDLEGLRLELLQLGPQDVDVAVHGVTRPLLHQPPEQLVLEHLLLAPLDVQLVVGVQALHVLVLLVEVVPASISSGESAKSRTSKVSDSSCSNSVRRTSMLLFMALPGPFYISRRSSWCWSNCCWSSWRCSSWSRWYCRASPPGPRPGREPRRSPTPGAPAPPGGRTARPNRFLCASASPFDQSLSAGNVACPSGTEARHPSTMFPPATCSLLATCLPGPGRSSSLLPACDEVTRQPGGDQGEQEKHTARHQQRLRPFSAYQERQHPVVHVPQRAGQGDRVHPGGREVQGEEGAREETQWKHDQVGSGRGRLLRLEDGPDEDPEREEREHTDEEERDRHPPGALQTQPEEREEGHSEEQCRLQHRHHHCHGETRGQNGERVHRGQLQPAQQAALTPGDQGERGRGHRRHRDTEREDPRRDVLDGFEGVLRTLHGPEEDREEDQEEQRQQEREEQGGPVTDKALADRNGHLLKSDHDRYSLPVSSRKTSSNEASRVRSRPAAPRSVRARMTALLSEAVMRTRSPSVRASSTPGRERSSSTLITPSGGALLMAAPGPPTSDAGLAIP